MIDTPALLSRLLDVIEFDLAPLSRKRIAEGDKIFGAAILRKSDLSLVVREVNNETANPLWHGEIHAIKRFFELPGEARPESKDCLFLATHEPCSLCLSGITWSGFDNFYYLFSYEDTRDTFDIPHDIRILREVYAVPDPDRDAPAPGRDYYSLIWYLRVVIRATICERSSTGASSLWHERFTRALSAWSRSYSLRQGPHSSRCCLIFSVSSSVISPSRYSYTRCRTSEQSVPDAGSSPAVRPQSPALIGPRPGPRSPARRHTR